MKRLKNSQKKLRNLRKFNAKRQNFPFTSKMRVHLSITILQLTQKVSKATDQDWNKLTQEG